MVKVNLPKVEPEIRDKLSKFKADHNFECPDDRLDNLSNVLEMLLEDSKALQATIENNNVLRKELSEANKKIRELEENSLTQYEIKALVDYTSDIDLSDTGDEQYTAGIKAAHMKLYKMLKK